MKRFISLLMFSLISILLFSACTGSGSTVSLDGSTSMEKVIGALTEGYRDIEKGVSVNYSGTGSGAGIEAVLSGVCDIGLSSRALKDSEIAQGAQGHVIALDGLAVIIHTSNTVGDLTAEQLCMIFTGTVTNWAQLGGSDAPIAVYGREAGSGTRSAFEEILGISDQCVYTNEYSSNGDIVGNVSTNPNGIGYVSLSGVGERVKTLLINGVPCSEETIQNGAYALQRPFMMVTNTNRPLSPEAQAFLDYATSDEAADYISIAGAIAPDRKEGSSHA